MAPGDTGPSIVPEHVKRFLRLAITVAIACFGSVFAGMIVSINLAGSGWSGPVIGCAMGFTLFFILGGWATGFWSDLMGDVAKKTSEAFVLPNDLAMVLGTHGRFEVVITVHKVECEVQGLLPWQNPSLYVEVTCGDNPMKSTCVTSSGIFNEMFKLSVGHQDDSIRVQIKNQDTFGARKVGHVFIPIGEEAQRLAHHPEEYPREYSILAASDEWMYTGAGRSNMVLISFAVPGGHGEKSHLKPGALKSGTYGATNPAGLLPGVEFNQTVKMAERPSPYATYQ